MNMQLIKAEGDLFRLMPDDLLSEEDREKALIYIAGIKEGEIIACEIKRIRNLGFHRKYFVLLKIGYDSIDTSGLEYKGTPVGKNFESFRKDVIIKCGFYEAVFSLNGPGLKLLAKSISFAKMKEAEFEKLYSQTINVLLAKVLPKSYDDSKLRQTVDRILGQFT